MISKQKTIKYFTLIVIVLCMMLILPGCPDKKEQAAPKKENGSSSMPKTPKALEEIEKTCLKVMQTIDSIPKIERDITIAEKKVEQQMQAPQMAQAAPEGQEGGEQGAQGQQQSSQGGGQQSSGGSPQKEGPVEITISNEIPMKKQALGEVLTVSMPPGSQEEQQDSKMMSLPELWEQVEKDVSNMNTKWNELEVELVKRNIPIEMVDGFEEMLDNLTVNVAGQQPLSCLMYANGITYYLAQFREYYQSQTSPIILTMQYLTRQVVLDDFAGNHQQALEGIIKLENKQNEAKYKLLEKNQRKVLEQFEMAVEDLKTAINKENTTLVNVKAKVLLENVKNVEKVF